MKVLQIWNHPVFCHHPSSPVYHHHHHKHPGLGHLARSVSRVTVALSIVSSASQLFSFLMGSSGVILEGFGFVAFFAGVKASSFCIHLSCVVCSLSVVRGEWSRLFCGHKGRVWRPWGWLPPNSLSEGLVIHPEDTLYNSESPEEAQDWYTNSLFKVLLNCLPGKVERSKYP
jgi:hypothetical protein